MGTIATFSAHPQRRIASRSKDPAHGRPAFEELLAAFGPPRVLARGEHLFHSGGRGDAVYLVEQGSIKVYRLSAAGDEQVLDFQLAGDVLGLDALGTVDHGCSAVTLEPTRVRALPLTKLRALCERSPRLHHGILQLASRRIGELQQHMLALGRLNAAERLAGFLLNLATRTQSRELRLSMSRYAVGCYLGLALETVSRLLHDFEAQGLIRVHGRDVALVKPDRLRALAAANAGGA
jgi:CRP/FNR family transcriptional regulator